MVCIVGLTGLFKIWEIHFGVIALFSAFFVSYMIPTAFLLYRRLKGEILDPEQISSTCLTWGPFRVRGVIGIANNVFALLCSAFLMFFSLWPQSKNGGPGSVGYGYVVIGVAIVLESLCYILWVPRHYNGPLTEVPLPRLPFDNLRRQQNQSQVLLTAEVR